MKGIRIGHEEIMDFMAKSFKVYSWRTVIRWQRKGMPIHRQWCRGEAIRGKPIIIESEVVKWLLYKKKQ